MSPAMCESSSYLAFLSALGIVIFIFGLFVVWGLFQFCVSHSNSMQWHVIVVLKSICLVPNDTEYFGRVGGFYSYIFFICLNLLPTFFLFYSALFFSNYSLHSILFSISFRWTAQWLNISVIHKVIPPIILPTWHHT